MNRRELLQSATLMPMLDLPLASQGNPPDTEGGRDSAIALYPQTNHFRQVIPLDGFWDFLPDPQDHWALHPGRDDLARLLLVDHGQGEGALELLDRLLQRPAGIARIILLDEVAYDLGVRFR